MATWSEVQAHMRGTYRLTSDEPNAMAMTWSYTDGRTQRIVVRRFINASLDMVEFKSPFARLGGPDPVELLRENARIPFGAVALSGDVFTVVHNAVVTDLNIDSFDALLSRVARLADRLEAKHVRADEF
jgi:hypothetical protein